MDCLKRMFSLCRLSATNNECLDHSNVCSTLPESLQQQWRAICLPVVLEELNEDALRSIDGFLMELRIVLVLCGENDSLRSRSQNSETSSARGREQESSPHNRLT